MKNRIPIKLPSYLFFLFLGLALLFQFVELNWLGSNQERQLEHIQQQINLELAQVDNFHARNVLNQSPAKFKFSTQAEQSPYPFFIYSGRKLVYWSTNELALDHSKFIEFNTDKVIVFNSSFYLVVHRSWRQHVVKYIIPLFKNYEIENHYLKKGLNPTIFKEAKVSLQRSFQNNKKLNIYNKEGKFLFGLKFYQEGGIRNFNKYVVVGFYVAAALCFLLFAWLWTDKLKRQSSYGLALAVLVSAFVLVRGISIVFNFPYAIYEFDFFSPHHFASSIIARSLGDFVLNTIFVLLFFIFIFRSFSFYKWLMPLRDQKTWVRWLVLIALLLFSHLALLTVFQTVYVIYTHSQWSLDVSRNFEVSKFTIVSLMVFMAVSFCFFITNQIFLWLFSRLTPTLNRKKVFIFFLSLNLSLISLLFWYEWQLAYVIMASSLLQLLQYLASHLKFKVWIRDKRVFQMFLVSTACAFAAAMAVSMVSMKQIKEEKQDFGTQLVSREDLFGEYLIDEAAKKIKEDPYIKTVMLTPLMSKEKAIQRSKKYFSNNFYEKYDIEFSLYDLKGNCLNKPGAPHYIDTKLSFKDMRYRTSYKDLFYQHESEHGINRYVDFVEIKKGNNHIGYLMIELKLKVIVPYSIYPALLVDEKFSSSLLGGTYSYAVYNDGIAENTFGEFNYTKQFYKLVLKQIGAGNGSFTHKGEQHKIIYFDKQKIAVVSSPPYGFIQFFSNFSFRFLLLVFVIFSYVLIFGFILKYRQVRNNFSTKIQIYLNIAFFVPLVLVTITTLSLIANFYRQEQNKEFITNARRVARNVSQSLESYQNGHLNKEELFQITARLGKANDADINIYQANGELLLTNQSSIFEGGLLSTLINPSAYADLIERSQKISLQNEKIGSLSYRSVYVAVRSFHTNKLLGVLSIPYFDTEEILRKQLITILTSILNVFTIIFILFFLVSFFASRSLTRPLRLLRESFRKTGLEATNHSLQWNSTDEIGLLVEEYNNMLQKIRDSKDELARTQKEIAWREMARQVAHEIKNPLTPMKLTLQHLQFIMSRNPNEENENYQKSMGVLLNQIDTLSDIATSFSNFAKMPTPKYELFNLSKVVEKVCELYSNTENHDFESDIEDNVWVMGDEQLMGRVLTNLILNGLQAVEEGQRPAIKVCLEKRNNNKMLLSVEDNGSGIPENISKKVFIPNFSTKEMGSGIGLAVSKNGVEQAGGNIWFETQLGDGTTFYIELPLAEKV